MKQRLVVIAILVCSVAPTHASTLIQCPDWKSFVDQTKPVVLARAARRTSFDAAVKRGATNQAITAKPSTIQPSPASSCPTYTVKKGDTLGKIAMAKLGTPRRYRELMVANRAVVKSKKTLLIGTVLTIPCALDAAGVGAVANKSKRKSWFGITPKAENPQTVASPVRVAAPAIPAPKPKPKPKPLPTWRAKSGEYLSDVVKRWAKTAGYKVVVSGSSEWQLKVAVRETGTFEAILAHLVKGFADDGDAPSVRVFQNRVIKIGSVR